MTNAYDAVHQNVAVIDRSDWGRIQITGSDRIRFLHNQTTNDFQSLSPGQSCDTVFVTSTARTLDLVAAYVDREQVLLLTSPGLQTQLIEWMDRYIFFADKVELEDVTEHTFAFSILGPQATDLLAHLSIEKPPVLNQHIDVTLADTSVKLAAGCGLAIPGYTLMGPKAQAEAVWQLLSSASTPVETVVLQASDWERLRIEQGRPLPQQEMTAEDNPLEAGLWHAISFEKGCYIGQETIARLNTYQGVKKQLWGLKMDAIASIGSPITHEGNKVGRLTSVIDTPEGTIGLGYIRTKAGGAGLTVQVGEPSMFVQATVIDVPFLGRGYLATAHA